MTYIEYYISGEIYGEDDERLPDDLSGLNAFELVEISRMVATYNAANLDHNPNAITDPGWYWAPHQYGDRHIDETYGPFSTRALAIEDIEANQLQAINQLHRVFQAIGQ